MLKRFTDIWEDIPEEARKELETGASTVEYRRGDRVYSEGEAPRGIFFVRKGLVGLVLLGAESGREHLVRFFRSGQFFGHRALFAGDGYHGTATVLENTEIEMIPRENLLRTLERHPRLYREILQVIARELRRCEMQHVMILENQILPRTAQSIVYLKDLHPEHRWTRQEIANFCASTVSTVIKALAELESRGLIRQEGRDIEIIDREGLISLQDTH